MRKIPPAFADAWAKHDGRQLAKMMADDVDFVTVGATRLHGRPDFEKYHSEDDRAVAEGSLDLPDSACELGCI
ncbi:MAG: hypothetical protein WCA20_15780 [Candidatus Sulfotelmatobacter sp.]